MDEIKKNPRVVEIGDVFRIKGFDGAFRAEEGVYEDGCENCCAGVNYEGDAKFCLKTPVSCRFHSMIYKRVNENR